MTEHASTSSTATPEPMIDAAELARRLSLSKTQVYRLAARGELPCLRVGGVVRFDWQKILDAKEGS